MIFFKKKHKFCPSAYGCTESLALKIFSDERKNLEKFWGGKVEVQTIHHWEGYVDYIVYTIKDSEK